MSPLWLMEVKVRPGPLEAAKLYWLCSKKADVKRCEQLQDNEAPAKRGVL